MSFENLIRYLITKLFCDLHVHMGIVEEHVEGAVAGSSLELKV
jgi:hypothetical protein